MDVLRVPDHLSVTTADADVCLRAAAHKRSWQTEGVEIATVPSADGVQVTVEACRVPLKRLHLRWRGALPSDCRFLGDHWERGYGDFEWRGCVPHRVMPWYFLAFDGKRTHGFGVKTGARGLCSWRVDSKGVSLWIDVRSGGVGVELGQRALEVATVVSRPGVEGESPFDAARAFCGIMCDKPLLPSAPAYGGNNWYYAYGRSSHEQILEDARLIASLAPDGDNRPFMVIDDGWQVAHDAPYNGGPWDCGNDRFPDLPGLAAEMKRLGVRPGIWFRPLWTRREVFSSWHLNGGRFGRPTSPPPLDPSVHDVLDFVAVDTRRLVEWGFELIKHDFSTFDICGRWGFEMPFEMTSDGWSFGDRSRTTAEIILDLYAAIRRGAGEALVLGCNTIGHLAAGYVELQRTGDDTSGMEWERTRRMGVNTLAFRMPQHGAFFAVDADCVGLTDRIDWEMNRRWLDLLARSGTPLFVSADPKAVGPDQRKALEAAFACAAREQPVAEPLDWLDTNCPAKWRIDGEINAFDWSGPDGLSWWMK